MVEVVKDERRRDEVEVKFEIEVEGANPVIHNVDFFTSTQGSLSLCKEPTEHTELHIKENVG